MRTRTGKRCGSASRHPETTPPGTPSSSSASIPNFRPAVMPVRLPCSRLPLLGGLLQPYWGAAGLPRPLVDLYVVGPGGKFLVEPAQIDTAADYSILASRLAAGLGLSLPFSRQVQVSGVG